MVKLGKVIVFSGPDCVGKSTLCKYLTTYLRAKGVECVNTWIRGTHTLASIIAKIFSKFSTFRGVDNPYYGIRIPNKLRKFWQVIEFISIIPHIVHKYLILKKLHNYVISDRGIIDFIVWNILITHDITYINSVITKILVNLNNVFIDYVFCLDVSNVKTLLARCRDRHSL